MTRGVESDDQNHTCEYRLIPVGKASDTVRLSIVVGEDWDLISLASSRPP